MSTAVTIDGARGRVESWMLAAYMRRGVRAGVICGMLVVSIYVLPWTVIGVAIAVSVSDAPLGDFFRLVAVNLTMSTIGLGAALVAEFLDCAKVASWRRRGQPESEASNILRLVMTAPVRWTNIGLTAYTVVSTPVLLVAYSDISGSVAVGALLVVGNCAVTTPAVWPVGVFVMELAARPEFAHIWRAFPDLEAPNLRVRSLRVRTLLPVPLFTLSTGYVVGLLVAGVERPIAQTAVAMSCAVAFTLVYVAILRFAVTESVLRPIDDLIAGAQRVAAGNLAAKVPITTNDEFASLARSFNRMTERLADNEAQMRDSLTRIVTTADGSRRRIERNLHDGAQQYLVMMDLKLQRVSREVADDAHAAELAADVTSDLRSALEDLRNLAHGLYPPNLEADGLLVALRAAAEPLLVPVAVIAGGLRRLPPEVEIATYFCCLEAMQNAALHGGQGTEISVLVRREIPGVRFVVADTGRGYDAASTPWGGGQQMMADRLGALGGHLSIESEVGAGTTVTGTIPVAAS